MPQASPRLRKLFSDDSVAWKLLEDSQNFDEHRFLIFPVDPNYKPTKKESDAIDYLIQEWDWDYAQKYVESDEFKAEHVRKMKIVHAVWLVSYMHSLRFKSPRQKCNSTRVINEVARLLGYKPKYLFQGFNRDYLDRAWCSRPADWKPQDSLA